VGENAQEIRPIHSVKIFGNVQLYEKGSHLLLMQILDHLLDIHEIVLNALFSDESSLIYED
jgi:hypothetical protein